ncbi:MAG: hypothetical protein ACKVU0_08525 [Saprospiraceae bacterium]
MCAKNILLGLALLVFQACPGAKSTEQKVEQAQKPDTLTSEEESLKNKLTDSIYLLALAQSIIADKWEYQDSDPRDENILPSMVGLLATDDPKGKNFWFLAVSKLLPKSDGALSEILGAKINRYVEEEPVEFFKLLAANNSSIPASSNLQNWTNLVWGEIQIEHEGEETAEIDRYVKAIKKKCSKITGAEKKLLDKFVKNMQYIIMMTDLLPIEEIGVKEN